MPRRKSIPGTESAATASRSVKPLQPRRANRQTRVKPKASGSTGGRPSTYCPEYDDQVRKFCLLGLKDDEIAEAFGVSVKTIDNWKRRHPTFLTSMRAGKIQADAEVAHSLYHRAKGYSHPAVKIMQYEGKVLEHAYTEHYPPDTNAARFWLMNRQRGGGSNAEGLPALMATRYCAFSR